MSLSIFLSLKVILLTECIIPVVPSLLAVFLIFPIPMSECSNWTIDTLRFGKPGLGHVLKHVPRHLLRQVLKHVSGHMLEHVPKHVPDRHVFGLKKMVYNFF